VCTHGLPAHPGEFIREDFLPDYDLSVADLAAAIKVSRQTVNELINEKRACLRISPRISSSRRRSSTAKPIELYAACLFSNRRLSLPW
jgi:predicted transcriptional regulator